MSGSLDGSAPARKGWAFPLTIALLALLSTFNSLPNGFTYDDRFVVVANPAVRQIIGWEQFLLLPYWPLHQGGDGYRPLAILLFAVEWSISQGPWLFHAVSIVLYATCSLLVLWLAAKLVDRWTAWWVAALFAVHPVHVEVTGGVVGQSELGAGVMLFLGVGLYIEGRRGHFSIRRQLAITSCYLAGALFKEHALILPLLLVAAELTVFAEDPAPILDRLDRTRFLAIGCVVIAAAYVALRIQVIPTGLVGYAPFTPFITTSAGVGERAMTMLGVVPTWARLLVAPWRLSTEYAPPAYPVVLTWSWASTIGALMLGAAAATAIASRRRAPVIAFAVAWVGVLLLPVSNIAFPVGLLVAERTLFAPSFGACILLALVVTAVGRRLLREPEGLIRVLGLVTGGGLLFLGVFRSTIRQADWRDNESLFRAAVAAEPRVYRAHYMLGAWYLETNRWPDARRELHTALTLFERDPAVAYNLGIGYFRAGDYDGAIAMFKVVERVYPGALDTRTRLALSLAAQGKLAEARVAAAEALQDMSKDPAALDAIIRAAGIATRATATVITR